MAKRKEKFPKQIFVGKDGDTGEEYFVAEDSPDGLSVVNDDREIAIYQLVRVTKIRNRTEVV